MAVTSLLCLLFLSQATLITAQCIDGEIELFPNGDSGHLLICNNSTLHQLCFTTGFTVDMARVACRQLGFAEGRLIGDGRVLSRFDFINTTFLCQDSAIQLTNNAGCSQFNSTSCASGRSTRIECYNNFLSFVPSDNPQETVPKGFATFQFTSPSVTPIGHGTFTNMFIYPYGLVSFGDTALNENQLRNIPDINHRTHTHRIVAAFFDPSLSLRLGFEGGLFYNETVPSTLVNRFISNRTGDDFEAEGVLLVEWELDNSDIEFQLIIASDLETTYAIITHVCAPGLRSTPASAYIGYSIYNYTTEVFRYSETPYSHEIGCLNEGAGVNYYNVLYRLSGNIETSSNTGTTCAEAGLLTGCCQPFNDPTRSCRVRRSTNSSCYCDSLCYRYGDCCSDVGSNGLETPCVPVCQNGTVNQEGNRYHSEGPISICINGLQRYIQNGDSNINDRTRDVICQQIIDQITRTSNLVDDGRQEFGQYFVDRTNLNCSGIERTVQQCLSTMTNIAQTDSVLMTNCINYIQNNNTVCVNGETRIRGPESTRGLVEICVNGRWRSICFSSNAGIREASFICSSLGHSSNSVSIDYRPVPNMTTRVTTFMCPPDSSVITNCTVVVSRDCPTEMSAHIDCDAPPSPPRVSTTTTMIAMTNITSTMPTSSGAPNALPVAVIAGTAVAAILVTFIIALVLVILILCVILKIKSRKKETSRMEGPPSRGISMDSFDMDSSRYVHDAAFRANGTQRKKVMVSTDLTKDFESDGLIIDYDHLRLLDSIGQGEFGLVYKAHLFDNEAMPTDVAVKTLKGTYNQEDIDDLLVESLKMKKMNHPNVMSLLGVCLDAGSAPFIVLPYMAGGCLLTYLKRNRSTLVITGDNKDEEQTIEIKLLSMSLQIAKGMEYIASKNTIHRDLAARNCMIDHKGVIKVSDFGLSKSLYEKMYFRQEKSEGVKLPIKWMAIESISDGIFSEKSDVWSFGVTCWEIFSGGKSPYGGITPLTLPNLLEGGHRMDKPLNNACSQTSYNLMLKCWNATPEERPTFSGLITSIENTLTSMADYIDFNQFTLQDTPKEGGNE